MDSTSGSSSFHFHGEIPASKSNFNRAVIIQSYEPGIRILGEGQCDDIIKMREAARRLRHHESTYDCGQAGTVFRFLSLRLAREAGTFLLMGSPSLLRRPQTELARLFGQLNVGYQMTERGMKIESRGWMIPGSPLKVGGRESSQFLSGLLLNCWKLPRELLLEVPEDLVSVDYFNLTLELLKRFGFQWEQEGRLFRIPPNQKPQAIDYQVESDVSSAFAVAALAAVAGEALLLKFPFQSRQPDVVFVDILKAMGVPVEQRGEALWIGRAERLKAIEWDLGTCPDLFPVLGSLAAQAEGKTMLYGAPQLIHKESNRIQELVTLLRRLGVEAEELVGGAVIHGTRKRNSGSVFLNTQDDHRLVMMAAVLKAGGFRIKLENTDSVNKSFPEFLRIAEAYL